MVSSRAIIEPEIDERKVRSESKKVEEALGDVEQIEPDLDTRGLQRQIDSVEGPSFDGDGAGFGAVRRGRSAGGGGGFGAGVLGGGLSSGGGMRTLGGAASKAAIPVALAGAVGFGMLKGIETVAAASDRFGVRAEQFSAALRNFRAPFGDVLAQAIAPAADSLLEASTQFRATAEAEGLPQALKDSLGPQLEKIATGDPFEQIVAGGTVGAVTGGVFGGRIGAAIGGAIGAGLAANPLTQAMGQAAQAAEATTDALEGFDADIDGLFDDVRDAWPGWPAIDTQWPGWPDLGLPSWPSASQLLGGFEWPTTTRLLSGFDWPSPSSLLSGFEWPSIPEPSIDLTGSIDFSITGTIQDLVENNLNFGSIAADIESRIDVPGFGDGDDDGTGLGGPGSSAAEQKFFDPGTDFSTDLPEEQNHFQHFQSGGFVPRGKTVAGILHGPEVVRPLDEGGGAGGGDEAVPVLRSILSALRSDGSDDELLRELQDLRREERRTRGAVEDLQTTLARLDGSGSRLISR